MDLEKDLQIVQLRLQLIETTGRLLQAEHAIFSRQAQEIEAQLSQLRGQNGATVAKGLGNTGGAEGGAP